MKLNKKRTKENILAFYSGYVTFSLEILFLRSLAPFFGSSVFVSSPAISMILAFISLGYIFNEKIMKVFKNIRSLLIFNAFYIIVLAKFFIPALKVITLRSLPLCSIIASFTLFIPVTTFSALTANIAKTREKENIGYVYGLATIGSIFAGLILPFVLLQPLGLNINYYILAIISFIAGIFYSEKRKRIFETTIQFLLMVFLIWFSIELEEDPTLIKKIESPEGSIYIHNDSGSVIITFGNKHFVYSVEYNKEENKTSYYEKMSIAELLIDSNKSLILGNGAGTLQSILKTEYNKTSLGVEINPVMTKIGEEVGQTKEENLIHSDARVFLNQNKEVFDVIYIDIYNNNPTIPCHTCSKEFFELVGKASHNETILVINLLFDYQNSSIVINKILRTISLTFPYLYAIDNIIFASKTEIVLPEKEEINFENEIFEQKILSCLDKFQRIYVDSNLSYYTDDKCNLEIEYQRRAYY